MFITELAIFEPNYRHPPDGEKDYDAQLTLDMASVMYVHTKRFVAEIQAFFSKFTEREETWRKDTVLKGLQAATSGKLVFNRIHTNILITNHIF